MTFLLEAMIFLGAAIVVVPISKRLGMSVVLGYLAAGPEGPPRYPVTRTQSPLTPLVVERLRAAEEERLYQDGTKVMLNEKVAATAHKLYDVSQDDMLNNDFVKPYSAYNFFARASFLRNPYVIRVLQILLDRPGAHLNSEYEENVQIHENSKTR